MEMLSIVQWPVATLQSYALPFLVALTVIIFIHELGHFLVARWCGVRVEMFSIGFGREIFGWNDSRGTRWKLCWIPLGGYVKFEGDANPASMPGASPDANSTLPPGNFHGKPVWQRAAVVAAGPIANFILAIAIYAVGNAAVGVPITEPRVDTVVAGSAAEKAGILPGDLIVRLDGRDIRSFTELQETIMVRPGEPVLVGIDRSGQSLELTVVPDLREVSDGFGGKVKIGMLGVSHDAAGDLRYERLSPIDAVVKGTERTWYVISTTFKYLGKIVIGQESSNHLGGPISIAKAAGDAASGGLYSFIGMIAFLSISIGLINLFPIPMLDGGHLVYYAIESIRGKPLGAGAQEWGFRIGFSLVIMLMIVGTWNDIGRLISIARQSLPL